MNNEVDQVIQRFQNESIQNLNAFKNRLNSKLKNQRTDLNQALSMEMKTGVESALLIILKQTFKILDKELTT